MRKILTILGAIGLTATTATSVVSCGTSAAPFDQGKINKEISNHKYWMSNSNIEIDNQKLSDLKDTGKIGNVTFLMLDKDFMKNYLRGNNSNLKITSTDSLSALIEIDVNLYKDHNWPDYNDIDNLGNPFFGIKATINEVDKDALKGKKMNYTIKFSWNNSNTSDSNNETSDSRTINFSVTIK